MFLGPAGTPREAIDRIAELTHEAVAKSEKVAAVRDLAGAEDTPVTGDALRKMIDATWPTYRTLTQQLGLTVG